MKFPDSGTPSEAVLSALRKGANEDSPWHDRKMFIGGSYFGGQKVLDAANQASAIYQNHNALYAGRAFPNLLNMERDIVSALLDLFGASGSATGNLTGGGTESLLLTVQSALNRARAQGQQAPFELVIPEAAHPGFDKAAHLMGAVAKRIVDSRDYRANIDAIRASVGNNTVLLAGSAPSFPFGVTDPIDDMAQVARDHRLWFHVDACHGGFVLPFAKDLGYSVPPFDFTVPGVTSLSVDLHKLGYANKGASALLLSDSNDEDYQRYSFDNWPGGQYSTAGLMGSRSAGGIASAWAMLKILGRAGYCAIVKEILTAREELTGAIEEIDGLYVLGRPDAYLVAFTAENLDIMAISAGMEHRGWVSGHLTKPLAIHLFLDRNNANSVPEYISDLQDIIKEVRGGHWSGKDTDTSYAR